MKKAVLLDRDGVIVEDIGYHHKIEDFKLMPNAIEGLKLLKNYLLIIITNQSGIGRGYYTMKDFEKFNNHLIQELKKHNIKVEKTYVCPHKPEDNCQCRKPSSKLIKDAAKEFDIDLEGSFAIGDRENDIEFGKNGNCRTILISNKEIKNKTKADYTAKDLLDAARWILNG